MRVAFVPLFCVLYTFMVWTCTAVALFSLDLSSPSADSFTCLSSSAVVWASMAAKAVAAVAAKSEASARWFN